ncbi:MAG TPA: GatB/YqeY domain-containing protein [Solirubrobacteraceae bacterium]
MVAAAVEQTQATSTKDMGSVMKAAMASAAGRADGKRVSARVRGALGG